MDHTRLAALEARVAADLEAVEIPPRDWLPERGDGRNVSDVVVVGAGLSGLTIAFGLMRKGIRRLRIIDAAPEGLEGPWVTTARMRTLRSPKTLSGPDWGVPSLTYRAWHEAAYGEDHFRALTRIPKHDYMAYLIWFKNVLGLPVENRTTLSAIAHDGELLRLTLRTDRGEEIALTRKLVLATGISGAGAPIVPRAIREGLEPGDYAHSDSDFDCRTLAGKSVAVIGAAASAFDFAVAALNADAKSVTLLARSAEMPVTEILDWSNFPGFLDHFAELPDEWRLRFTDRMLAFRAPPTQEMYDRATGDPKFSMICGEDLAGAQKTGGGVTLTLNSGRTISADALLLGTGYGVDLLARPELAPHAPLVALWRDKYVPPEGLEHSAVLDYPYLGPAFELLEREPGTAPLLRHVHLFNNGAVPSLGPICNGVTGLKYGAPRLVAGITRALFMADVSTHYAALDRFDKAHFAPRAEHRAA
ncbi:MAG: NAD(P)/FAD-dependent oxidoreductase [Pseudomonadota bacterium]